MKSGLNDPIVYAKHCLTQILKHVSIR